MSQEEIKQVYDLNRLREVHDIRERRKVFASYYDKCVSENVAPYLSNFLVENDSWGSMPLEHIGLAETERQQYGQDSLKFRIKVICDEWGNKPKPGDEVYHMVPNAAWRKATPKEESYAKRIGKYDEKYKVKLTYKVDEKGCIRCPFQTAVHFLNQYGLHSISREPLTKKPELSSEPVLIKKGDTAKKYVHYWRFEEVTDEQYKALPKISKPQNTENK